MKKKLLIAIFAITALMLFASCSNDKKAKESDSNAIRVFTREEGSGTRDAFFEMIGMPASAAGRAGTTADAGTRSINDEFADNPLHIGYGSRDEVAGLIGNSAGGTDRILSHATVASGTGAISNAVAASPSAVGYISLGAKRSDIRTLPVDGVMPSVEAVTGGTYPLVRNFYIAVPARVSTLAQDFINFIQSAEGRKIISGKGYVSPIQPPMAYSGRDMGGPLQIEGSTSVAPVMRALAEAYMALHSNNVKIEIRATGSSAGIMAAREGRVDMGMSSRSIRAAELEELSNSIVMAHDGIAVIVHPSNTLKTISVDDIRRIFSGELVRWNAVGAPPSAPIGTLRVFTREEESGTRSAFIELTGIHEAGTDRTSNAAAVASGTGRIINAVAGNPLSIGYISLGAMRSDVRPLPVDGVAPSVESVIDGTYPLVRNFYIAVPIKVSARAQDFIDFIISAEGQKIVSSRGYVSPIQDPPVYSGSGMSGTIQIEGSTSVAPVMRALADAYTILHGAGNIKVEVRSTGSGAGIAAAREGRVDLGMSSRSIRGAELDELSESIVMAHDGIAVIVHPTNGLPTISINGIRQIYTGGTARWEDLVP